MVFLSSQFRWRCGGRVLPQRLYRDLKSSDYNYIVPKRGNANKAKILLKESHKDEPQNMRNISAKGEIIRNENEFRVTKSEAKSSRTLMALWRGLEGGLAGGLGLLFGPCLRAKIMGLMPAKSNFTMFDPIHVWIVELKTAAVVWGVDMDDDMVKSLLIMYKQQVKWGKAAAMSRVINCIQFTDKKFRIEL